jgi:hypothetical protein
MSAYLELPDAREPATTIPFAEAGVPLVHVRIEVRPARILRATGTVGQEAGPAWLTLPRPFVDERLLPTLGTPPWDRSRSAHAIASATWFLAQAARAALLAERHHPPERFRMSLAREDFAAWETIRLLFALLSRLSWSYDLAAMLPFRRSQFLRNRLPGIDAESVHDLAAKSGTALLLDLGVELTLLGLEREGNAPPVDVEADLATGGDRLWHAVAQLDAGGVLELVSALRAEAIEAAAKKRKPDGFLHSLRLDFDTVDGLLQEEWRAFGPFPVAPLD